MAEIVTLQLPETLAQRAKEIAAFTHQRLEDVLLEFIDRAITELPIESLPNEQVLALCDMQMETEQQEVFSDLLARNQEGQLNEAEVRQLDELMQVYRKGLVRKARALKVAVERGLKSALT
ncbi:MAG: hypothetical protein KME31_06420 [Tolypothrix carrinoi HA7290-LM1]|jgi:hypothetical protein|nr:hypothetical protein [Tolypothrix carrinoi HA7290-LM1]